MSPTRPFERLSEPRPGSSHDQIARILGGKILAGVYKPGDNLPPEPQLLSQFSISRTVLREVMKTLSAKGLVISKTRVGTRVAPSEAWNLFDAEVLAWRLNLGLDEDLRTHLAEVRRAIEPMCAALAAERRTEKHLVALRKHVAAMGAPNLSREGFAQADLEFHLTISEASGNPMLRSIGAVIEAALYATFAVNSPVEDPADAANTVRAHAKILKAIEIGDADGAARAMVDVINLGAERVSRAGRRPLVRQRKKAARDRK